MRLMTAGQLVGQVGQPLKSLWTTVTQLKTKDKSGTILIQKHKFTSKIIYQNRNTKLGLRKRIM
jgi:hypothetical protein